MITVIVGPPCAGKSTFVSRVVKSGDMVIDYGLIGQSMNAKPHSRTPQQRKVVGAARRAAVATLVADANVNAYMVTTYVDRAKLDYLAGGIHRVQAKILDPGMDECIRRAKDEGRPAGTVQRIKDWYDNPPTIPEEYAVKNNMVNTKTARMEIKSAGESDGLQKGQVIGYASVFGNKDSYGDVVIKGAFAKSLASYGGGGAGIPVYWSHRMDDPTMNIGKTLEATEDEHGLLVKMQLDLDSPNGAYVHRLIEQDRVKQMSFAYDVVKQAEVDGGPYEGGHMELQELKIHEVSVVPVGANQETELLAVKVGMGTESIEVARLTSVLDSLHGTIKAMTEVIESFQGKGGEDSQAVAQEDPPTEDNAASVESKTANSDPGSTLSRLTLLALSKPMDM